MWDTDSRVDVILLELGRNTRINYGYFFALIKQILDFSGRQLRSVFANRVIQNHTAVHDRIFGRRKRRSVGQIQVEEIFSFGPKADCGDEDINPFVHTIFADDLRTEYTARYAVCECFDYEFFAP